MKESYPNAKGIFSYQAWKKPGVVDKDLSDKQTSTYGLKAADDKVRLLRSLHDKKHVAVCFVLAYESTTSFFKVFGLALVLPKQITLNAGATFALD